MLFIFYRLYSCMKYLIKRQIYRGGILRLSRLQGQFHGERQISHLIYEVNKILHKIHY